MIQHFDGIGLAVCCDEGISQLRGILTVYEEYQPVLLIIIDIVAFRPAIGKLIEEKVHVLVEIGKRQDALHQAGAVYRYEFTQYTL